MLEKEPEHVSLPWACYLQALPMISYSDSLHMVLLELPGYHSTKAQLTKSLAYLLPPHRVGNGVESPHLPVMLWATKQVALSLELLGTSSCQPSPYATLQIPRIFGAL